LALLFDSENINYRLYCMKRFFVPFLAIALSIFASCGNQNVVEDGPAQVGAVTLKDTSCVIEVYYPATMSGVQDVAIYPQVSGRITKVRVVSGQFVRAGEVLFDIDDVPYRASYDSALASVEVAKTQVATAQSTLQSKQNLFDRGIISQYQLDLAKNELASAEAVLGQANAALTAAGNELSFTKVKSAISGYIGELPYMMGSLVGPSIPQPLTIVSDNSQIYADFSIPENIYLQIVGAREEGGLDNASQELTLITNDGAIYEHKGRFHSASGLISKSTGALSLRSIFPNPDTKLLSGGSCQVLFGFKQDNAILIPRTSIKEVQDKKFVFIIKDNVLTQVEINAQRYDNSFWLLLPDADGSYPLKGGDVITNTTNRLINGQEVAII